METPAENHSPLLHLSTGSARRSHLGWATPGRGRPRRQARLTGAARRGCADVGRDAPADAEKVPASRFPGMLNPIRRQTFEETGISQEAVAADVISKLRGLGWGQAQRKALAKALWGFEKIGKGRLSMGGKLVITVDAAPVTPRYLPPASRARVAPEITRQGLQEVP